MTGPEMQRLRTEHVLANAPLRIFANRLLEPYPVHWHEFYELAFVRGGGGKHILNGVEHSLARGSMFLLTPADFHELLPNAAAALELYNVVFSDQMLGEELRFFLFAAPRNYTAELRGAQADTMEAEFGRLEAESEQHPPGYQHVVNATLQRVLVDLARQSSAHQPDHAQPGGNKRTIQQALTFIHHHFRNHLTLDQAAAQAHLSPNYFSERFHQATGTSFQTYVQELRLRFAVAMLSTSHVPVTDICFAAGFSTLSHFEKTFKRKYGQSPRAYRDSKAAPPRRTAPSGSVR